MKDLFVKLPRSCLVHLQPPGYKNIWFDIKDTISERPPHIRLNNWRTALIAKPDSFTSFTVLYNLRTPPQKGEHKIKNYFQPSLLSKIRWWLARSSPNSLSPSVSVFITSPRIIISLWLCNFHSRLTTIKAPYSAFTFKVTVVFHCNQKPKTYSAS